MGQLGKALQVIRYLQRKVGGATFGELLDLLAPISRTTLSKLLMELVRHGEVEHEGRLYRLRRGLLGGYDLQDYCLSSVVQKQTQEILERTANKAGHACALFAWVGETTMKIVDQYNLEKPHWSFSPVGYEWPLVPFHGFAKVFLAYSGSNFARLSYERWSHFLKPDLLPNSWAAFDQQLKEVRKRGYALEYKEERSSILRLVMPVLVDDTSAPRFAVGLVARNIYLLELKECVELLKPAAVALAMVLRSPVD